MKTLTNMKKVCFMNRFSLLVVAVCVAIGFSSCGSDDPEVPVFSTKDVEGSYTGKMVALNVQPNEATEEPAQGTDITAEVKDNNVVFNKFPIADIVKSIVGEEAAGPIIEAIGDVKYQVAYQATFNEKNEIINLQLEPKPLEISFAIPAAQEGEGEGEGEGEEPNMVNVTVTVIADQQGTYTYAGDKLTFKLHASEVLVGEEKFEAFVPTTFDFDLNKN